MLAAPQSMRRPDVRRLGAKRGKKDANTFRKSGTDTKATASHTPATIASTPMLVAAAQAARPRAPRARSAAQLPQPKPRRYTMVTSMQGALARRLAAAKDDLITEYFRRTQAADEAREHETSAAVRIQSRWRAHITRSLLAEWNGNALHIERVYRGHLSRVAVNAARRERRIYWQRIYFSHCATSIQKWCARAGRVRHARKGILMAKTRIRSRA